MLVKYISLAPEITLLLSILLLQFIKLFRSTQTPKTFFSVSKACIWMTLAESIVFYNLSFNQEIYVNSLYTTFFKCLLLLSILLLGGATGRWFLNQNHPSCGYYQILMWILFNGYIAISSRHMLLTAIAVCFLYAGMIKIAVKAVYSIKDENLKRLLFIQGLIVIAFLSIGLLLIYITKGEYLYQSLKSSDLSTMGYIAIACFTAVLLTLLGAAPFHFAKMQIRNQTVLPVAMINSIILPIVGLAVLLEMAQTVTSADVITNMMLICGILSVVLGGLNGGPDNTRKIFGGIDLFNIGVILIIISQSNIMAISGGILYFLIYLISMIGIYLCFYGIRSHGENLVLLSEWSGLSETKPYISASILVFCASLMGLPPFLGMLGNLIVLDNLLVQQKFALILLILLVLVFICRNLIAVMKSIYHDKRKHNFDRADSGVYWGLLVCMFLVISIVSSPENIMQELKTITETIMQAGK